MRAVSPVVLTIERQIPASASRVWAALTTPHLMRRWMLVPPCFASEAALRPGDRLEWHDDEDRPYLVGTVVTCEPEARLTVALQDRSWSRPAASGEVVWEFVLTANRDGTRLAYRLGDLAIDPHAADWCAAYAAADEPARLAALLAAAAA